MSTAAGFLLIGFALGAACAWGLIRAERSTPSPLPRSRPGTSQVSEPARAASSHPSNVRVVRPETVTPNPSYTDRNGAWLFPNYAARYAQECREVGQDEVLRRRAL